MSETGEILLEAEDLRKRYGRILALDGLSLALRSGEIFGLIGPNGAGKTTTLRILATVVPPDGGAFRVCGVSPREDKLFVRRRIGFMPDRFGFYKNLRVTEYLHFFAAAYGADGAERGGRVDAILELVGLFDRRFSLISGLSRGMLQRLDLGRALVHDPCVLLLDEPASGLDPLGRIELRELLRELARMGKAILISSHILSELEEVCQRIGILDRGSLLYDGRLDDLRRQTAGGSRFTIRVAGDLVNAEGVLLASPEVASVVRDEGRLIVTLRGEGGIPPQVSVALGQAGIAIVEVRREAPSLEEIYVRLLGAGGAGGADPKAE
ncbi:MAG: ABC transporter ATP-binding protein [Planctomycetes bacterium]|nr:ABC transporter ATP-binding protein [Planctomycetota bacterium]